MFGYVPEQVVGYTCSILQGAETEQDHINALMNNVNVSTRMLVFIPYHCFISTITIAEESPLLFEDHELHQRQSEVQELDSDISAVRGRSRLSLPRRPRANRRSLFHVSTVEHRSYFSRHSCHLGLHYRGGDARTSTQSPPSQSLQRFITR